MAGAGHKNSHIIGLDLVRFSAAFLVVLFHFSYAPFGWVGVEIFFVLSGAVIARSAQDVTAMQFLIGRVLRLVPCVWICATITAMIWFALDTYPATEIVRRWFNSAIFWPSPPWVDIVYWTLHVEVGFYAIVFLLLCFAGRRFIMPTCILIGLWSVGANLFADSYAALPSWFRQLTLAQHGCLFAIGVLLSVSELRWTSVLIAVFYVGAIAEIRFTAAGSYNSDGVREIICFSVFLAAMIASIHYNHWAASAVGNLAGQVRILGLTTYPLYLIHYSLKALFFRFLPQGAACDVAAIAMVVIVALLITLYAEPLLKGRMRSVIAGPVPA